jgi:predicted MFS family arabinose efflux permease
MENKKKWLKNVRILYIAMFLRNLSFFGGILVPFFTEWGGITKMQMMLLQSWFTFWIFLLEVPTGAIADKWGRKLSMFFGAISIGVAAMVYSSAPILILFFVAEFFFALGTALISGADEALLYDSLVAGGRKRESSHTFGRMVMFQMGGILISAPIGSLLAQSFGLQIPMFAYGISAFLSALLILRLHEPKNIKKVSESERYLSVLKGGFRILHANRQLMSIVTSAIFISTGGYFIIWLYQSYLEEIHTPVALFGFFISLCAGTQIIIGSQFGRIRKWMKPKQYMLLASVLTLAGFLVALLFRSYIGVIVLLVVSGGFGLTFLNFVNSTIQPYIPSEKRAVTLSSISMFRRLSTALLGPFIGYLSDHSFTMALGILPIFPALSILIQLSNRNAKEVS